MSSCSSKGSIDYFKLGALYAASPGGYRALIDNYIDRRFEEMGFSTENETQKDFLREAKYRKCNFDAGKYVNTDHEIPEKWKTEPYKNEKEPHYENLKVLFGDLQDLKKELQSKVTVEDVQAIELGNHKGYEVVYRFDWSSIPDYIRPRYKYIKCTITILNNGNSECHYDMKSNSLSDLLR